MTYKALLKTSDDTWLEFDDGQLPELYYIIYATMYPGEFSLSEHDHVFKNSQNLRVR